MRREQFTFYRSFYEAMLKLPKRKQFGLLLAVIRYALDGVPPCDLNDAQIGQFILIKPTLDASRRKAKAGSIGGKISKRGPAEKISKGEIEKENEIEIETESEGKGEGFARFWERYPLKLGEVQARELWERVCEEFSQEEVLSALERWRNAESWKRENGRFIPKAEKWLSERWWLQEPKQAIVYGASGQLGKAEMEAIEQLFED